MSSKVRKSIKKSPESKPASPVSHLSESVKNYAFADFVSVQSYRRGMLLSFGKSHPNEKEFLVFKEVLLPFDVALSLQRIMKEQMDTLIDSGDLVIDVEPKKKRSK